VKRSTTIVLCLFTILLSASLSFAEMKAFVREYTYEASELDSKSSCRAIALEQVKRLLLEELGTYVQSVTVVKHYTLDQDQITTLTAGVVQTRIREETWDGKKYWLKAEINADPDEVAASINKLRNDQQLVHDLAEAREEAEQALRDVESLKEQLSLAQVDQASRNTYDSAVNQLIAADGFERGQALMVSGNYEEATRAYGRVIVLNPNYVKAYTYRGLAYVHMGYYNRAVYDFDRAITLNPGNKKIYVHRAIAIREMKSPAQRIPQGRLVPGLSHPTREIRKPADYRAQAERKKKQIRAQQERQLQKKPLREERQQERRKTLEGKQKKDKQKLY
jgi:tetratricopeptide (TPR) repeat protein